MMWHLITIVTREDWATALATVVTPQDAARFMHRYRAEQPEHADAVVGYMLNELPPRQQRAARAAFGLTDPFNPTGRERSFAELFAEGVRMGRDGSPAWFKVAMSYPRRDPNPSPYWPPEDA